MTFHLFNVEVRVGTGDDGVELLVGEHGQPLRFDHLQEAPPEEPGLLLDLLVALEVGVGHYEVHLVVAVSHILYLLTMTCLFEGGLEGHSKSMNLCWPLGKVS